MMGSGALLSSLVCLASLVTRCIVYEVDTSVHNNQVNTSAHNR